MAVRSSMTSLIASVRVLINDTLPLNSGQVFTDQQIQDVMDESRVDIVGSVLIPKPTYSVGTIQYLDYYSSQGGGWEDDYVLKQYLAQTVTASAVEPIAGHFQFSASTLPPVYAYGKLHDRYRSAADLLERWAAKWALSFDFSSDSQSFHRSQASTMLLNLARQYRQKQRPTLSVMHRSDLNSSTQLTDDPLKATWIDRMASGNGS